MKRLFQTLLVILLFVAPLLANSAEVTPGGSVILWNFMWQNLDLDDETSDADHYNFFFGNATLEADFGHGITAMVHPAAIGEFGNFASAGDPMVSMHQLYIHAQNLFDSPLSLRFGKERVLYGTGLALWDGGAEGLTGVRANVGTEMVDVDFFTYRLEENGGVSCVGGFICPQPDTIDVTISPDRDLFGAHATLKLMEEKVDINGYYFMRKQGDDSPSWVGVRTTGDIIEGLTHELEFVMMTGTDMADMDYKGVAYIAHLAYSPPEMPFGVGGAYLYFSGDDPETMDENEAYHNVLTSPFLYDGGFNGFIGFGPVHLLRTGGFATDPSNLSVIDAKAMYEKDALSLRLDYFMYSMVEVPDGVDKSLGNEISLVAKYNYEDVLTFGVSGGYFLPGEFYGTDLEAALGGIIFLSKSF